MAGKSRTDYREDLRMFLQDFAPFNRLLRLEEESSDPALEFALEMALDTYNTTILPLLSEVTFETFPSNTIMIRLAASNILEMVGILRTRNSLNYSDAGLAVNDTEKASDYRAWALQFKKEAMQAASLLKQVRNIESILSSGGIGSDYAWI